MTHKFNPEKKDKLISQERYKMLPPDDVLEQLLLKRGDIVADIGCGIGYFSLPAAKLIGQQNTVYAVDISREMLIGLKERMKEENIDNIELVEGSEYSAKIPNQTVDFMLIANVLHEIDKQRKFLEQYLEKIATNGRVAIIEFIKKETEYGPTVEHRISKEEVKELLTSLQLEIIKEVDLNSNQYGIVAELKG